MKKAKIHSHLKPSTLAITILFKLRILKINNKKILISIYLNFLKKKYSKKKIKLIPLMKMKMCFSIVKSPLI